MPPLSSDFVIRPAQPKDVPDIFELIQELARYEKLEQMVTGSSETLERHLFGQPTYAEALVASIDQHIVGFALFFTNYSTFLTQPGLYLEDLFVHSDYRRQGIGKALLQQVANLAVERNCGRLEWSVLDWNENAISVYQRLGATVLPDWRICRVVGHELQALAHSPSSPIVN
ncbi:Spermidine/spermine N(1)-acetyltransferase [Acaryochloris thomasi RCC1774]|uniref:Spermidine/spermine N(1)-acetyltransferase n=1 Tax=Acaryochloris thomasi RCC1774 TaxID=1764569 RepID=A0A2W1JPX4_9CYAN|nr:GNAT family N-acetyltransferase [Acaryochloris thomasi]PZD75359.1 Spermidine/spermine N(1)-acetyltransferase [Acaryochloris thomasi RCC1774]